MATEFKPWYKSKVIWLNILNVLIGSGTLIADYFSKSDYSPTAVTLLITGILGVVLRVYFTNTQVY